MSDFLGKVIFFLIVGALIIYIISLVFPFLILGGIIYLGGRKFKDQLEQYRLSLLRKITLFLISAVQIS